MATRKRKVEAKRPLSADTSEPTQRAVPDWVAQGYLDKLSRIADALEKVAKLMQEFKPPVMPGPAGLDFIDGQWRRRAGDVYARVAEPGSPNAGDAETFGTAHDDNPPRSL
jgi:hypothetical protein